MCVGFHRFMFKNEQKLPTVIPAVSAAASWAWPLGPQAALRTGPGMRPSPPVILNCGGGGGQDTSPHLRCVPFVNISFLSPVAQRTLKSDAAFLPPSCGGRRASVSGASGSVRLCCEHAARSPNSRPCMYFRCPFRGRMTCSGARLSQARGVATTRAG